MMKEIASLAPIQPGPIQPSAPKAVDNNDFSKLMGEVVNQVEQSQVKADQAVQDLNTGKAENLHEVMISLEEADISMRFMVQVRNKAVEAYQEVMRMQV